MRNKHIDAFAAKLRPDDEVVVEATGNAMAVAERRRPYVGRVVVTYTPQIRDVTDLQIPRHHLTAPSKFRDVPTHATMRDDKLLDAGETPLV